MATALLTAPTATAAVPAATTSGYHIVDLGVSPSVGFSRAAAINERGHVVGFSNNHAAMWRDGRIVDLGVLPGDTWSRATDLNDRDEVVGYSAGSSGLRAFLWRNGRMRRLPGFSGSTYTAAEGINNAGDVVGASGEGSGGIRVHAVHWHSGRLIDLDPVGTSNSWADDITDNGWIVGTLVGTLGDEFAAAWRQGHVTVLFKGVATAANDRRQAVGHDLSGTPLLWSRGTATALREPKAGDYSEAWDINNRGQIVGRVGEIAHGDHAALWQRGKPVLLPRLPGSEYGVAMGINERGQIVGWSYDPKVEEFHAVLWTR